MAKSNTSKGSPESTKQKLPPSLLEGALPRPAGEVWAAGVGALSQARKKGGGSFETLVALGSTVADKGGDAARAAVGQVERAASALAETAKGVAGGAAETVSDGVESVVEAALAKLGVPGRDEVLALRAQVDALQARLAELLDHAGPSAATLSPAAPTAYEVRTHARGWAVQRVGAERATAVHPTKKEALQDARQTARAQAPSRLTVYKADGTVGEEVGYEA